MGGYKDELLKKKELAKSKEARRDEREKKRHEIDDLRGKDKIKYDIDELESHIKNCKYDLNGMFKGNKLTQAKLENLEKQLILKQEAMKNEERTAITGT